MSDLLTAQPPVQLSVTDPAELAVQLVGIGSVSGDEARIASAVEAALSPLEHLEVIRDGNCVLARTRLGRPRRAVLAGHLDTVPQPVGGSIVAEVVDGVLSGRGAVDMLGGVAAAVHLAATVTSPALDMTYVFYDNEEVEAARNGLTRLARTHPDWLAADMAILGEPTANRVEGGCQGSLTVEVTVRGRAGHAARAWLADNAVHKAAALVTRVGAHQARQPVVDGLQFHEGLQVVRIRDGGNARNVVPGTCTLTINHRFPPDRDLDQAMQTVREVLAVEGTDLDGAVTIEVIDAVPGARPGLDTPAVAEFAAGVSAATGRVPSAKLGWTDVARFAMLGVPAVNFGPGEAGLAHADDERVVLDQVRQAAELLRDWMTRG